MIVNKEFGYELTIYLPRKVGTDIRRKTKRQPLLVYKLVFATTLAANRVHFVLRVVEMTLCFSVTKVITGKNQCCSILVFHVAVPFPPLHLSLLCVMRVITMAVIMAMIMVTMAMMVMVIMVRQT